MRTNFNQQKKIGVEYISDVTIPDITRDELPPVLKALQYIFKTPELNEKVFRILSKAIKKSKRGRKAMSLWEILVLAIIRNSLDTNYDRIHDYSNNHILVRKLMGVHQDFGYGQSGQTYGLQTIKDNVRLLSEDTIKEINTVVVESGHSLVMKKHQKLNINTDTYALESNVHFPTDLNLLWDSTRKVIDLLVSLSDDYNLSGWRRSKYWQRELKGAFRLSSYVHKSGGKNKDIRLKKVVDSYISLAKTVLHKALTTIEELNKYVIDKKDEPRLLALEFYKDMLIKHIDLTERRIIKDEKIPASEKLVSIFETHTEWLQKGKSGRKKVEFGHNMLIASDQFQFIVYHKVIESTPDVELTEETINKLYEQFPDKLHSVSFDKGFSSKEVKKRIESSNKVEKLILPKRGKLSEQDKIDENEKEFKQLRNKHSRIESDINRLEHNGLNTCPDKGFSNFKRYASLGVLSYNLHNLGKILIEKELKIKNTIKAKAKVLRKQAA